jgi:hypothetical protein
MSAQKKSTLYLETLPSPTASLFEAINSIGPNGMPFDLATRLFLVGGTALSLQIGHRMSNDLDLACAEPKLPTFAIDQLVELLKKNHELKLITSTSQISAFKIQSGLNLLDYVRDYSIDNVKVSFFSIGRTPAQKTFYQKADKLSKCWAFPILGIEGLKLAKTLVLAERVRSRDLFDLMYLVRDHGYLLSEFNQYVESLGVNNDFEYYKAVMTGEIPVDKDDEEFAPFKVTVELEDIYLYFREQVNNYEVELARKFFESTK